jgi:cell division protein FtsI/penicillin-binding protein 2
VGASGVEAVCNALLAGRPGVCESDQDASGNELPFRRSRYVPAQDGHHVVLTIDMRLQQIVEQALLDAWTRHRPRSVSIIIVRPRTGEILAWGCLPGFAPREPGASPPEAWRNRPISDWFEPGSTFKIVTLAATLNEGLVGLDQGVDCERGLYRHKDFTVRDYAPHGVLTARQCLARSSCIGHAKLGLLLGADRLHRYATNFGFGRRTGIALPGETAGRLDPPQTWTPMTLSRIAFGQGLAASQLQSTLAMAAIANDGRLMRPLLVWRIESPEGRVLHTYQPQGVRTVITPRTAQAMKSALQSVVSAEGTALRAALENFTAAGKTGTAEKSDQRGYRPGAYYASFIGFFPVAEPELCISVALDEPQEGYFGGQVAAPIFHTVAEQSARCLNLTPDKRPTPAAADRAGLARSISEAPRPALAASH